MFSVIVRRRRPIWAALLSGGLFLLASPAVAACNVVGADPDFDHYACSSEGVRIKLIGPSASVELSDFLLQPTGSEGYVSIFATDTEPDPTDIIVELLGDSQIYALNYDGFDIRTARGDILVNIGEGTLLDADQTGLFVRSSDDAASGDYFGGNVVVNNYGMILSGPQTDPMGANGISALANAGAVTVNNFGTIIVRLETLGITDGRGIVADGGYLSPEPVQVSIYNSGTVDALHDGLRINSYNGLGKAVNDVAGIVTSRDRRGVVVWSPDGAAEVENYGVITALDGSGVYAWAGGGDNGYARLTNGGRIVASDNPDQNTTDTYFVGAHIWSATSGDATLINLAGGEIIASDGIGAFLQTADGSVVIDNAGRIEGQSTAIRVTGDDLNELAGLTDGDQVPDYAGAVGGDITLTNSGVITATGTTDFTGNAALISLAGHTLGETSVTNLAGGFIGGGGFAEGTNFSLSALNAVSAAGLDDLLGAANNAAIALAVAGTGSSIDNYGTLIGRVQTASPFDVYGAGAPTSYASGALLNAGLWITSGNSGYFTSMAGTLTNTGTIFTLGETTLAGAFDNAGAVWINATATEAASLTINSPYTAVGNAAFVFDLGAGAKLDGSPLVAFRDDISGQTDVVLFDMAGWDWTTGEDLALIEAEHATLEFGADSFGLADPVEGLVRYSLAYEESGKLWSLRAELAEESVAELGEISAAVAGLSDLTSDLLSRTDDLRDMFAGPVEMAPMGYAATPHTPVEAAFAALTPPPGPVLRGWVKADAQLGGGTGFAGRKGSLSFGADITAEYDATLYAAGLFGTLSGSALDYATSGSAATVGARAVGAYGTVMAESGLFASGVVAVQLADIGLQLAGESTQFGALSGTGRIDVGYQAQLGQLIVEPSLGYRLGTTGYDDFTLSGNLVSIADVGTSAVEGRVRISQDVAAEAVNLSPFAILSVGQSFASGGAITLSKLGAVGIAGQGGAYAGLATGLEVQSLDGRLTTFARADFNLSEQSLWGALKLGGSSRF